MAGLTLSQAMTAIRDTINDANLGIDAYYPVGGMAPEDRCILLYSGSGTVKASNDQRWLEQPRAIVILSKADDAEAQAYADDLIEPFVDLFDPTQSAGYTLGYRIDRCTVASYQTGLNFTLGGMTYNAMEFRFDMKRHRQVGDGVS